MVDATLTLRAHELFFDVVAQIFFFERALVAIGNSLPWAEHGIDSESRERNEERQRYREHLENGLIGTCMDITVCPDDARHPQQQEVSRKYPLEDIQKGRHRTEPGDLLLLQELQKN